MTASLSLGSAINAHNCSVKPNPRARVCSSRNTHTPLYFYLYYMLTLHPLPPFPSATLYWQQKLTSSPLSFYPFLPAEKVTHVVIQILMFWLLIEESGWGQSLCEHSVGGSIFTCVYFVTMSPTPPYCCNWFSTILFTKAKPSGMFWSNFEKRHT